METQQMLDWLGSDDASKRLEAVNELGLISESSDTIVRELLIIRRTDSLPLVKEAATTALNSDANKRILDQYPDIVSQIDSIIQLRFGNKYPTPNATAVAGGTPRQISWIGVCLTIAGILAVFLPKFGYNLVIFGNRIPPQAAVPLCVIGVGMLVSSWSRK